MPSNVQPLSCSGVTYGHGLTWSLTSLIFTMLTARAWSLTFWSFRRWIVEQSAHSLKVGFSEGKCNPQTHMRIDVEMWSWTFAKNPWWYCCCRAYKKKSHQVKSLKKPDLVDELTKRGVVATGTVKELKERLNTLIPQLKTRYASDQKRTDVLHLNKDITAFDAMCSASDDILLVSSNAQRQIYLVSVAKDGVGLVGSVSEL